MVAEKKRSSVMRISEQDMLAVISEVMLEDPASETPKVRQNRVNITRNQLSNLLIGLANDYHDSEVDVDLTLYKNTVLEIKAMKSDSDFDRLMDSFFEAYPQ